MATLSNNPNAAEINVAVVPDFTVQFPAPPQTEDLWSEEQKGDSPYAMYYVTAKYGTDEGDRIMPVAGPSGTPCRAVRIHGGRGTLRIAWEVRRIGKKPVLPGWRIDNPNIRLLEKHINPDCPKILSGGQSMSWRVMGLYVYALLVKPADDEDLAVPLSALIRTTLEPVTLSTWQFDHRLLNFTTTTLRGGGLGIPVS